MLNLLNLSTVVHVELVYKKPAELPKHVTESSKSTVETLSFTCIKALEIIKRTVTFAEPLGSIFDKSNILGIAIDVQVRTLEFPLFDKSVEGLKSTFEALVSNYELANVDSALDLLQKWDKLNSKENNFFVGAHIVTTAFDETYETYFRKLELKDFIVEELKHYKYDWVAKIENAKKNKETNLEDVNSYLDCFKGLRCILVTMATNRSGLFSLLEKFVDFLYFVHMGVNYFNQTKLHDKADSTSKGLFMFPMELALWTSSKKLEIGFELDLWPTQLVPFVLFWMHSMTNHMNGNRVAFLHPFSPYERKVELLALNKFYYDEKTARGRGFIYASYFDFGRLALMKANLVIVWLLEQAGAVKRFMNERELELAYDAKIYLPFADFFFIKRQRFYEAQKEINDQITALGANVIYSKKNTEILMKVKGELFEASKDLNLASKEILENETEKTEIANLAKVY